MTPEYVMSALPLFGGVLDVGRAVGGLGDVEGETDNDGDDGGDAEGDGEPDGDGEEEDDGEDDGVANAT